MCIRDRYWDGTGWQKAKSTVEASLKNKNGLISDWEYPVDFSEVKDKGNITVIARSSDDLANISNHAQFQMSVDAVAPETELNAKINGSTIQSPATIWGTCSDDFELSGVEVKLERLDDQQFWNGRSWSFGETTFLKPVKDKKWHIEVPVAPGKYRVIAGSVDRAGNRDRSPATAEFSVQ